MPILEKKRRINWLFVAFWSLKSSRKTDWQKTLFNFMTVTRVIAYINVNIILRSMSLRVVTRIINTLVTFNRNECTRERNMCSKQHFDFWSSFMNKCVYDIFSIRHACDKKSVYDILSLFECWLMQCNVLKGRSNTSFYVIKFGKTLFHFSHYTYQTSHNISFSNRKSSKFSEIKWN